MIIPLAPLLGDVDVDAALRGALGAWPLLRRAIVDYPLKTDGVAFYADAEEVLAKAGYQWSFARNAKPFAFSCVQHIVQRLRKATSKVDYVEALAH